MPVEVGRVNSIEDLNKAIGAFENHYTTIYPSGARYPEAGYQITEIYVAAVGQKRKPELQSYELKGEKPPAKGQRDAYMDDVWKRFDIWEMDLLKAGYRVDGPAIIEHPMTTLVIPPENYVQFDERKFIWYRIK